MQADSPALVATLPNGNTPSTTAAAAVAVTAADEQYYRRLCSDLRSQNKALEQSCQQDLALLEAARSQLRHSRLEQNFLFSMLSRVRPDEATILKKQQRQQRLQSIQLNQQQMESGMDAMSMMDINDNSNNMAFGDNSIVDFDMDDYMLNDANTIATASTTAAVAGSGGSYGNLLELGNGTPSSSMMGLAPLTVAPSRGASRSSDPALLVNPGISTPSSVTGSGTASRRGGGGGAVKLKSELVQTCLQQLDRQHQEHQLE
ncbi:hypothetical protein GQ42DRAFT_154780 [Ramicandelaber brevisporus]|nr:hypothetical protein GQ42DRAFT_154780 [Ramicandelaber brevisporus]